MRAAAVVDLADPVELVPDITAPGTARAVVVARLRGDGAPCAVVEAAELLCSEIVTDAVRHGLPGPLQLRVQRRTGGWAVLVEWRGDDAAVVGESGYLPFAGVDPVSLRGRRLVDATASRWHVVDDGLVTTVRLELDRPHDRPAG